MNPPWSVIVFTTLAGGAQGLLVLLAVADLAQRIGSRVWLGSALVIALAMLLTAMGVSFLHLRHPRPAWRAIAQWRSSWLSREIIVLTALALSVALWLAALAWNMSVRQWPVLVLVLCAALWLCTGMIYSCLRFIVQWAGPRTSVNLALIGATTGSLLLQPLAELGGERALARAAMPWTVILTLSAWAARVHAMRRADRLPPRSSAQSATGLEHPQLRQVAMGTTGATFNTREFTCAAPAHRLRQARWLLHACAFALPAALVAAAWATEAALPVLLPAAALLHWPGVLAERWLFFARVRHPQNLYTQNRS